ncbi:MAG: hypothetical protein WD847_13650 [Pirellulales bacterium]
MKCLVASLVVVAALGEVRLSQATAQITLRDNFDTPETAWRDAGGDLQYRIELHQRVADTARSGVACEAVQVAAGQNGTCVYLAYEIGRARVIAELMPSLWLRSDRAGLQMLARVVLPRTLDPGTGKPIVRLVAGPSYTRAGQWQQLRLEGIVALVAAQARTLRAELATEVDPREAYVDHILLNVYGGAGRTQIWIDDLEVPGFVEAPPPAAPFIAASSPPVAGSRQAQPPSGPRAELSGSMLLVDGRPLFPRIVEHRGESLAFLKKLGFNAVELADVPDETILAEADEQGMWLVCPPPRPPQLDESLSAELEAPPIERSEPLIGRFDERYNAVLAWHLGSRLTARELETTKRWAEQVQRADAPHPRPLACAPDAELKAYSRIGNGKILLSIDRSPLGTSLELSDYATWIRERPRLARPGTPFWATVQTQPAAEWTEQVELLSDGRSPAPAVESEQISLLVQAALAAGCRGICFTSSTPLDASDAPTRQRALALELVNLELALVHDILARASLSATLRSSEPAVGAAVLETDRTRLLLPLWSGRFSQLVPGESAGNGISFVVPGVPEANDAYEITPAGLRKLAAERRTGGVRLAVDELSLTSRILLSGDHRATSMLTRRVAAIGQRAARLQGELARLKYARTAEVEQRLILAGRRVRESDAWQAAARRAIQTADGALQAGDYLSAWQHAQRGMRPLRLIERAHWDQAAGSLGSPMASPLAASFATLPDHWSLVGRIGPLQPATGSGNLLAGGQMEDLQQTLAAGWRLFEHPQPAVAASGELADDQPHSGTYSLRLSARAADMETSPLLVETAPLWLVSPAVMVEAGQLVRISGWVRISAPITGSVDGLMIIDSLGGESLAERIGQTSGWRQFALYRAAPASGPLTVTLALTGLGEVWIDDLAIELISAEE